MEHQTHVGTLVYSLHMQKLVLLGVVGFALVGCAPKADPFVGTWESSSTVGGLSAEIASTFNADHTFSVVTVATVPGAQKATFKISHSGTWSSEGKDKLTTKIDKLDLDGSGLPAQMQPMFATTKTPEAKAKMLKDMNAEPTATVTWTGNDEFSAQAQGQKVTFKRKK